MTSTEITPNQTDMIQTAREYIAAGLAVLPVKADKRPAVTSWQSYQNTGMTVEEFMDLISKPAAEGWQALAVICGPSSGGFETIDVDQKADPDENISAEFMGLLHDADPALFNRLAIATTPSGGIHIYYRRDYEKRDATERQGGLAYTTAPDGRKGPALIETRILGGYAVVPPMSGRAMIQGDMTAIPTITEEERALIFNIARSLSQYVEPEAVERAPKERTGPDQGETPWDHYNRETRVEDLLTAEGWQVWEGSNGRLMVRRPGATSATSGNIKNGKLWLWSTGAGMPSVDNLKPNAVYTYLKHGGNFTASARELRRQGYGSPGRGDIRTNSTRITAKSATRGEIELAAIGGATTVTEATAADVELVYIDITPASQRSEIWGHIEKLDTSGGPDIMVRQEGEEPVLSSLWMLDDILGEYQRKMDNGEALTQEDEARIMARLSGAVRVTKNGITRDRLIDQAVRWDYWPTLGITKEALRDRLDELSKEAAKAERWSKLEEVTAELEDARQREDVRALGIVANKLEAITKGSVERDSVEAMDPGAVKRQIMERKQGLKMPWKALKDVRFRSGEVAVIMARPNVGKTCFLASIATNAAITHKDRVFYYVFYEEGSPNFYAKLIRHFGAMYWTDGEISAGIQGSQINKRADLFNASMKALDIVIHPRTGSLRLIHTRPTLEAVQERLRKDAARGVNISGLFVDHATITEVRGKFEQIRERQKHVSRILQAIAIEMDIPVLVASQVNRDGAGGETPELHHVSESDNLVQDAATVISLGLAKETGEDEGGQMPEIRKMKVNVLKLRDVGKGKYTLNFYTPGQRIYDEDGDPEPLMKLPEEDQA